MALALAVSSRPGPVYRIHLKLPFTTLTRLFIIALRERRTEKSGKHWHRADCAPEQDQLGCHPFAGHAPEGPGKTHRPTERQLAGPGHGPGLSTPGRPSTSTVETHGGVTKSAAVVVNQTPHGAKKLKRGRNEAASILSHPGRHNVDAKGP